MCLRRRDVFLVAEPLSMLVNSILYVIAFSVDVGLLIHSTHDCSTNMQI